MERAWQQINLSLTGNRLQSRNDGYADTRIAYLINKTVILVVVEEHLCDNVVGTSLHLLLQIVDVCIEVGCFVVFFGLGCHTHAEICWKTVLYCGVKILSLIQVVNHSHQF